MGYSKFEKYRSICSFTKKIYDIIYIMLLTFPALAVLKDQAHTFHTAAVFRPRCHNVNTSGIDAAMAKNICKLCDILFKLVKGSGEQAPQIVRKYLLGIYLCF